MELWSILNLVTHGSLFDKKYFKDEFENPIKLSKSTKSDESTVRIGMKKETELMELLRKYYLCRKKESLQGYFINSTI